MFCSTCGKPSAPGEVACAYCHAPLAFAGVPAGAAGTPPQTVYRVYPQTRVARHIQIMGILWLLRGLFSLLGWLIAVPFLTGFFGRFGHEFGHRGFGPWGNMFHGAPFWIPIVTAFVVIHAAISLITAYGLLTRQSWGRVLAIVAAILSLIRIPFGTALGVYTLIILLRADAAAEYESLSSARSW